MILLNEVNKKYIGKTSVVKALDNISISFPNKGMIFILGKSGSGKTTLLNVLGLIDDFDSGKITFDGTNIMSLSEIEKDSIRGNKIGFIFQDFNLLSEYNVEENIRLPQEIKKENYSKEKIDSLLREVELEGYNSRKINELSGGQKQRVAIARALIKKPKILLCDEPTGSLDSETSKKIFDLLKKISSKTLVVIVSHDREYAEKYADRIIKLKDGQVESDSDNLILENDTSFEKNDKIKTPFKMKIGFSLRMMKKRIMRLFFACISSIIALSMLGITSASSNMNMNEIVAKSMIDSNKKYINISKKVVGICDDNIEDLWTTSANMDEKDVSYIKKYCNVNQVDIIYNSINCENVNLANFPNGQSELSGCYTNQLMNFIEIDEEFIRRYNFDLYGNIPQNDNEVIITYYEFLAFKEFGYQNINSQKAINTYDDIIGEIIYAGGIIDKKDFTIVGVLDTKFDIERYKKLNDNFNDVILENELKTLLENEVHTALFMKKGFNDRNVLLDRDSKVKASDFSFSCYIGEDEIFSKSLEGIDALNCNIFRNNNTKSGVILPLSKWLKESLEYVLNMGINNYCFEHFDEVKAQLQQDYPSEYINAAFYENVIKNNMYQDSYLKHDYEYFYTYSINRMLFNYLKYDNITKSVLFKSKYGDKDFLIKLDFAGFVDDLNNPLQNEFYLTKDTYCSVIADMDWIVYSYKGVMIPLEKDINKMSNIIGIRDNEVSNNIISGVSGYEYYYSSYSIENEYTFNVYRVGETAESFQQVMRFISIVLLCLSVVLMFLYFSGLVFDIKKEIGILRSLGVGKKDLLSIFLTSDSIITMICFGFATILSIIGSSFLARYFNQGDQLLSFIDFSFYQVAIIFGISIGCVLLGTTIPVYQLIRKKIVSLIRD